MEILWVLIALVMLGFVVLPFVRRGRGTITQVPAGHPDAAHPANYGFAREEELDIRMPGPDQDLLDVLDLAQRTQDYRAAQQLLAGLLKRDGLSIRDFGRAVVAPTGPDVAQAVRAGHADFGIATRAVATAAGLGFVPVCNERFDLLMRQRDYFRPPMQAFLKLLGVPRFAERARELGGLDVTAAGSIRWSP